AEAIVESGSAAQDLDRAARQELFLAPVGGVEGWYRHDSLIADLLRVTLQHELPLEVAVLHARAARWFEAAGRPDDAMYHAATAPSVWQVARTAARLVDTCARPWCGCPSRAREPTRRVRSTRPRRSSRRTLSRDPIPPRSERRSRDLRCSRVPRRACARATWKR